MSDIYKSRFTGKEIDAAIEIIINKNEESKEPKNNLKSNNSLFGLPIIDIDEYIDNDIPIEVDEKSIETIMSEDNSKNKNAHFEFVFAPYYDDDYPFLLRYTSSDGIIKYSQTTSDETLSKILANEEESTFYSYLYRVKKSTILEENTICVFSSGADATNYDFLGSNTGEEMIERERDVKFQVRLTPLSTCLQLIFDLSGLYRNHNFISFYHDLLDYIPQKDFCKKIFNLIKDINKLKEQVNTLQEFGNKVIDKSIAFNEMKKELKSIKERLSKLESK